MSCPYCQSPYVQERFAGALPHIVCLGCGAMFVFRSGEYVWIEPIPIEHVGRYKSEGT